MTRPPTGSHGSFPAPAPVGGADRGPCPADTRRQILRAGCAGSDLEVSEAMRDLASSRCPEPGCRCASGASGSKTACSQAGSCACRAASGARDHLTYLATPYSHPDPGVREARYRAACAVAAVMTTRGDLVYSPVAHGHGIALSGGLPVSWEYWGRLDRRMLAACDSLTVVCVAGWRESNGVQAEIAAAHGLGLPVRFVDPCGNPMEEPK